MARVLIVTCDGGGNVPPAIGVADALVQRGHQIKFLAHPTQRDQLSRFDIETYTTARPWSSITPKGALRGIWETLDMFSDNGIAADTSCIVQRWRPHLLIVDCMLSGALEAARESGVKYHVLGHTLYSWLRSSVGGGLFGSLSRAKGHRIVRSWAAAETMLMATDRHLDPAGQHPVPANVFWSASVPTPTRANPKCCIGFSQLPRTVTFGS